MNQLITLNLYGFGLCAALAGLLLLLTAVPGRIKGLPIGTASLFCAIAIPMALLMARLAYVLINIKYYIETYENPAYMLCFWDGGLSMTGALLGVVLAGLIAAKISRQSFAVLADAFVSPLGLSLAVLFYGEHFTDLGTGKTVAEGFLTEKLPFLVTKEPMGTLTLYSLKPWLYEAVAFALLALVTALLFSKNHEKDGATALLFFILAGPLTIFLESMRDDGHMLIIFLRIAQVGGLIMVMVPFGILWIRFHRHPGRKKSAWLCLLAEAVAIAGIVLIEFALDGRLSFGAKSMVLNYAAMLGCCVLMGAVPCIMLQKIGRSRI